MLVRGLADNANHNTPQYTLSGIDKEFYDYYTIQHNLIDFDDTLAPINPYYFDIDCNSGMQYSFYGEDAFKSFEEEYGIELTEDEKEEVLLTTTDCGQRISQEGFNKKALKKI